MDELKQELNFVIEIFQQICNLFQEQILLLDVTAGGWATYKEIIPAVYGNYIFENKKLEAEIGITSRIC